MKQEQEKPRYGLDEIIKTQKLTNSRIQQTIETVFGRDEEQEIIITTTVPEIKIRLSKADFVDPVMDNKLRFNIGHQIHEHTRYVLNVTHPNNYNKNISDIHSRLSKKTQPITKIIEEYASNIDSISQLIATIDIMKQFLPDEANRWKKSKVIEKISKNAAKDLFATEKDLTYNEMILYLVSYLDIYHFLFANDDRTQKDLDTIAQQFFNRFAQMDTKDNTLDFEKKKRIEVLSLLLFMHHKRPFKASGLCDIIDRLNENDQK